VQELKTTFNTYQQRTNEMAVAQRETITRAREAVAQHAEQQAHQLHLIEQNLEQLVAPGYDQASLALLARDNPQEFIAIQARLGLVQQFRQHIQQQMGQLTQQAQQQRQQAQQEQQQAHQQLLMAEKAKLQGKKWWNADFQTKAAAFAKKNGIPEHFVQSLPYAGAFEILRDAMTYRELVAKTKGGRQAPTPQRQQPAATPARGQMRNAKQVQGLYDHAAKTGDRTSAGKWLDQML
jgi:hypothetical protein